MITDQEAQARLHADRRIVVQGFAWGRTAVSEPEKVFSDNWIYRGLFDLGWIVPDVTHRDEQVAATVLQWLGSPVGFNWLCRAVCDLPRDQKERLLKAISED